MNKFTFFLLLWISPFFCFSNELSLNSIRKAAANWILHNPAVYSANGAKTTVQVAQRLLNSKQEEIQLVLVKLDPQGYVILTTDTTLPPVIAFSQTADVDLLDSKSPFFELLFAQGEIFKEVLEKPLTRGNNDEAEDNQLIWSSLLNDRDNRTRGFDDELNIITAPLMTCQWGQRYPFNLYSPSSCSGLGKQAVSGCVPTALAQILYHHQWPPRGNGGKTHTDWGLNQLSTLKADFTRDYPWNIMKDAYSTVQYGTYPSASEQAVGRLLSDMGVLCEVDFEEGGTGGYIHTLNGRIAEHLQFQTPVYVDTYSDGQQVLYKRIRDDLIDGIPVYLGNHEHAFIAHGLASVWGTYYCYMNYGWYGVDDGWFRLESVYDRSAVNAAITNLRPRPVPLFHPMDMIQNPTAALEWDFPKTLTADAFRITAKQSGGRSYTVADNIPGTIRQYELQGDILGNVSFQIAACVDGIWHSPSPALQLSLSNTKQEDFQSDISTSFIQTEVDTPFNLTISSSLPIASINVSTTRPDIFPDSCSSISIEYTTATITMASAFGRCGRALLWLDIISQDGRRRTHEVQVEINKNASTPYWAHSLAEARKLKPSSSSLILMIAGDMSQKNVQELVLSHCRRNDIKQLLLDKFTIWFADTSSDFMTDNPSNGSTWVDYTSSGSQYVSKPVISIISSFMFTHVAACHEGSITADQLYDFLNMDYSSAIPSEGTILDNTQRAVGSDLVFRTSGNAPWFITSSDYYSSSSSLRSGRISDSQSSMLTTEVIGAGILSFAWNANSEFFDKLCFYLDGEQVAFCSGRYHSWETKSYTITNYGKHSFIWCYVKDESTSYDKDCGWIDDVIWTPAPSHLYASTSALALPQNKGRTMLDIFANIPWTASSDVEWIDIDKSSGTGDANLSVNYQPNETIRTREAIITISDGLEQTFTCKVTQEACDPQMALSKTNMQLYFNGGSEFLDIMANCPWTIRSDMDWLQASPDIGGGDDQITVIYSENPWCKSRNGLLTAIASVNGQQITATCTVTQAAAPPILELELADIDVSYGEGEAILNITSANGDWTAECDGDWLAPVQSSGMGPGNLAFQYTANESLESRNCNVTIRLVNDDGVKAVKTCRVNQEAGLIQTTLTLRPGWNLLALPLQPTDDGLDNLLAYKPFIMDKKARSYVRAAKLEQGTPFWVFSKTIQDILWTAKKKNEWTLPDLASYHWNFVGIAADTPIPDNAAEVWEWDGGRFARHPQNAPLSAGHAFWIWCE